MHGDSLHIPHVWMVMQIMNTDILVAGNYIKHCVNLWWQRSHNRIFTRCVAGLIGRKTTQSLHTNSPLSSKHGKTPRVLQMMFMGKDTVNWQRSNAKFSQTALEAINWPVFSLLTKMNPNEIFGTEKKQTLRHACETSPSEKNIYFNQVKKSWAHRSPPLVENCE